MCLSVTRPFRVLIRRQNRPGQSDGRTDRFSTAEPARTVGFGKRDSARTVGFGKQAASAREIPDSRIRKAGSERTRDPGQSDSENGIRPGHSENGKRDSEKRDSKKRAARQGRAGQGAGQGGRAGRAGQGPNKE